MAADIALIVGLGNPGPRYSTTRHNVGFHVVDELAMRSRVVLEPAPWGRRGRRADGLWLAEPGLYMNRSGVAALALLADLGLDASTMLVVVDDVDLPLGALRLRRSGGPGTHNGLRDLVDHLGPGFPRLRVGVRGVDAWDDLAAYVLSEFPSEESELVETTVERAADAVECAATEGLSVAMNLFNRRPEPQCPAE